MKGDQAWRDKIENTTELLQGLHKANLDVLVRDELGALKFDEAVEEARRLKIFFAGIKGSDLETISYTQLNQINRALISIWASLNAMRKFNLGVENPAVARQKLVEEFYNHSEEAFNSLYAVVAYLRQGDQEANVLLERARNTIAEVDRAAQALNDKTTVLTTEAEKVLALARTTAATGSVSKYASFYKDEAKMNADMASNVRWWLVGTGAVVAGLAAFFYCQVTGYPDTIELPKAIQLLVAKAALLALGSYALVLLAKSYFSAMHNAVVNRHRQNALSTFEALVAAGGDAANRDIVLIRAADAIFGAQPSAYSKHDASDVSMLPIMSLAQQAAKVGSSH